MYSLRYGTVPVVRYTGGLADTVVDLAPGSLESGRATGFVFRDYNKKAFAEALGRALDLFPDRRKWLALARSGMAQDWSWDRSAALYEHLYRKLVESRVRVPV